MKELRVTYKKVKAIIGKMLEAGVLPTSDLIHRAYYYKADKTQIKKYLKQWRDEHQGIDYKKLGLNKKQTTAVQKILDKRTEELENAIATYRATLECSTDGIMVVNNNGRMVDYNERFRKMWRLPRHFLENRDDMKALKYAMNQCKDPEGFFQNTINIYDDETGEGRVADIELKTGEIFERYSLPQTVEGKPIGRVWANRDVTERRRVQDELRLQKHSIEASPNGVIIFSVLDKNQTIEYVNPAVKQITGFKTEELLNQSIHQLVRHKLLGKDLKQPGLLKFKKAIKEQDSARIEIRCYKKNGELFWNELHIAPILSSGKEMEYKGKLFVKEDETEVSRRRATHYVAIIIDITERKAMEEQLLHQATHDALTNLPNRALLQDRIIQAISYANRQNGLVSILFFDLDHFKLINDSLGHKIGDELLRAVAKNISACLRSTDTFARIGGDEYVIVLTPINRIEETIDIADRLLKALRQSFNVHGKELNITASIGISTYPKDGHDPEVLIRNADTAMYQAKDNGRDNLMFFTKNMNKRVSYRLNLQNKLRGALDRGELHLHYQPIIALKTERIVGVESLIRWAHPDLGPVSPTEFIPLAEETGLIVPIGEWVIYQTCQQWAKFKSMGLPPLTFNVNLSGKQLKFTDIVNTIKKALKNTRMDPNYLVIELTESILMDKTEETIDKLNDLKKLGIKIAIDDFGTGYSSLSYLNKIPLDKLKIDQSFISEISGNIEDEAIILAIIAIAKNLNLKLVAEGVETEQQIQFLQNQQCDEIQGYYYSKPLALKELVKFIQKHYELA